MTDDRDHLLLNRFAALSDRGAGDWDDVVRRAGDAHSTHRLFPRSRPRLALGGAATVAVSLTVAGVLLLTTRGREPSPSQQPGTPPPSVVLDVTGLGSSEGPAGPSRFEFDFANQRYRVIGEPPETIVTPDFTFIAVAPDRRTLSNGRPWARFPTGASSKISRLLLNPKTWQGGSSATRVASMIMFGTSRTLKTERRGSEAVQGKTLTRYTLSEADSTIDAWVDSTGRFARARWRLDGSVVVIRVRAAETLVEVALPADNEWADVTDQQRLQIQFGPGFFSQTDGATTPSP